MNVRIHDAARTAFMQHGFTGTSLRSVAKFADVSPGNMYNYFGSKNALFSAVTDPMVRLIDDFFDHIAVISLPENMLMQEFEKERVIINRFIELIDEHRDMLRLLVTGCAGSTLEDYRLRVTKQYHRVWQRYLLILEERAGITIPSFTVRNVCHLHVNAVEEALRRDLAVTEMRQYAEDILRFTYFGFKSLITYHGRKLQ